MTRKRNGHKKYERNLETAKRDAEACRLRAQNYTYDQIAAQLKFANRGNAHQAVQRALKDITREPAEELRTMELERLDGLASISQRVIEESDDLELILKAVDRHLKIQARRAALMGLDAPAKSEVSGPAGDPISMQVADFAALPAKVRRERLTELAAEVTRRATANTTKNDDD